MSDPTHDALGLGRLVPGPGWIVLDAARDGRFTGELSVTADEVTRVYFDRGRIYLAERESDPSLGSRLVEAGAITSSQLAYGRLQILDIEYLGRLFDRVPTVSRDGVLAVTGLMNEHTVSWLATQQVRSASAVPYRHHESGMHQWSTSSRPGLAAPAPPTMTLPRRRDDQPFDPPTTASAVDADDLVEWDDPTPVSAMTSDLLARPPEPSVFDRPPISDAPVPAVVDGPLPPPPPPAGSIERFEVIWPTGEVEDVSIRRDPDPPTTPSNDGDDSSAPEAQADEEDDDADDDSIAVRRAVATIDTGSLAARRRLVEATGRATAPAVDQSGSGSGPIEGRSDVLSASDGADAGLRPANGISPNDERAGAIRRLIGSLRR